MVTTTFFGIDGQKSNNEENINYIFVEGKPTVAMTVVDESQEGFDEISRYVDADKNLSMYADINEKVVNICMKSEIGEYYSTIIIDGDDFNKLVEAAEDFVKLAKKH